MERFVSVTARHSGVALTLPNCFITAITCSSVLLSVVNDFIS